MNVGIVTTWFERGAAYVSRQYRDVLQGEHDVFIYARGGESYLLQESGWAGERTTVGKKPKNTIGTAIDLGDFRRWIDKNRITCVIFNEQQWWPPVILCKRLGVLTGAYIDYYTEQTITLFGCYDFLLCNTKRHYEVFDWHPQCFYIPWGTDVELFKPQQKSRHENEFLTFFHSAGMNPGRKGTDLVIRALAELHNNTKLIVHTQKPLDKCFPDLTDLIRLLVDNNRLQVIEKTVGAPGLYYLGDVYLYPSLLDGIGLTIAEAMASGLPVITTNSPPMNEFVVENTNGQLVDVERYFARADGYYWPQTKPNLESLISKMSFYCDHLDSIDDYKFMARQYAERYLSWKDNASSLPAIVKKVACLGGDDVTGAVAQAEYYERNRGSVEFRHPVAYHYISKFVGFLKK